MRRLVAVATVLAALALAGASPREARAGLLDCLGLTLTASPDTATTTEGVTLSVAAPGVLANDVGLDLLGTATAHQDSGTTHGTATLRSDGGYTYVPASGFAGTDQFRYHVVCGLLSSASTTVTITVSPPPTPTPAPTPSPTPRPTPSPTPRATPTPTPRPTPTPTPTSLVSLPPLPTLPLPTVSPWPTLPPLASLSPLPTLPPVSLPPLTSPTPTPAPTASPFASPPPPTAPASSPGAGSLPGDASASGAPPDAGAGSIGGSGPSGDDPAEGRPLAVPGSEPGAVISVGSVPIDIGAFAIWLVPGFALTVPGLIIVLIVAAQLAGGGLFVPIARRRLRGTGVETTGTLAG